MTMFKRCYDGTGEGNCLPLHLVHSRRLTMTKGNIVLRRRCRRKIDWTSIQIAFATGLVVVVLTALAIAIQIGNTLGGVQ